MAENLSDKVREYIEQRQGKIIELAKVRIDLGIDPASKAWGGIYTIFSRLVDEKKLRASGKRDGIYKVIIPVNPIPILSTQRERRPPYDLMFPRDFDTMMEMDFAKDIVTRGGDLILISGMSNYGKTTLCLNFCGENIDKRPVLMGNEYTTIDLEPTPRFMNRLDAMDWVEWVDVDGNDKITLLPVRDDYAEHIIKDRINIIDWINIETGEHYMIGTILEGIKKQLGQGIAIIAIQKAEGATAGRGGQFTKDFADLELLIDKFGTSDVLLTIGKVKEYNKPVIGKTYAYGIQKGVKIFNFREVKKCPDCHASGYKAGKPCETCSTNKYINC